MLFYERKDVAFIDRSAGGRGDSIAGSHDSIAGPHDSIAGSHDSIAGAHDCSGGDNLIGGAPRSSAPYGMPDDIYTDVLCDGLQLMHKLHVSEESYGELIRRLVEGRCDEERVVSKSRRRLPPQLQVSLSGGRMDAFDSPDNPSNPADPSPRASQRSSDLETANQQSMTLAVKYILSILSTSIKHCWKPFWAWESVLTLSGRGVAPCVELIKAVLDTPAKDAVSKALTNNSFAMGRAMTAALEIAIRYEQLSCVLSVIVPLNCRLTSYLLVQEPGHVSQYFGPIQA
jgi:hypothetical protein